MVERFGARERLLGPQTAGHARGQRGVGILEQMAREHGDDALIAPDDPALGGAPFPP